MNRQFGVRNKKDGTVIAARSKTAKELAVDLKPGNEIVERLVTGWRTTYDPRSYSDDRECICGHTYVEHYAPNSECEMIPSGCQHCGCEDFSWNTGRIVFFDSDDLEKVTTMSCAGCGWGWEMPTKVYTVVHTKEFKCRECGVDMDVKSDG